MDITTSTERPKLVLDHVDIVQENLLLELIKETCSDEETAVSNELKGKVNRIIADCDLTHYTGLHKLSTADESTSTLLGLMGQTNTDLTFDEQIELNQALIVKIQTKLPKLISELEQLKEDGSNKKSRKDQMSELQESLDDKLRTLEEQENEKVELMMEWLNHRLNDVMKFSENSSAMLTLKTRSLELKSKILHLQILKNIFTETNQSIKAYSEIHKDLKESIKETEDRIKHFKEIVKSEQL